MNPQHHVNIAVDDGMIVIGFDLILQCYVK